MLGFWRRLLSPRLRDRGVIRVTPIPGSGITGGVGRVSGTWKRTAYRRRPLALSSPSSPSYSCTTSTIADAPIPVLAVRLRCGLRPASSARLVSRFLFAFCATAILLIWYLDVGLLRTLQQRSLTWGGWGRLVQSAVLPYSTWLVVAAMIALVTATRRTRPRSGEADG